jgi:hypothetical protein
VAIGLLVVAGCAPSSPSRAVPPDNGVEQTGGAAGGAGDPITGGGGMPGGATGAPARDSGGADDAGPEAGRSGTPLDASATVTTSSDGGLELRMPPGTVLWLDAARGVTMTGGKVSRWADQSSNGNDAGNGSASHQPMLVMREAGPAIHFSGKVPDSSSNTDGHGGTFLRVTDGPSIQFGKEDWLIETVIAYTNKIDASHNGVLGAFFGKWGSGGEILFCGNWTYSENPNREQGCIHLGFGERAPVGLETSIGAYRNGDTTHYLNDGKVRIIAARRIGNRAAVRINGKQQMAGGSFPAGTDLSFPGANVGIGSFSARSDTSADRSLQGDIYFMMAMKAPTIDDKTVADIEAALTNRFHPAPIP